MSISSATAVASEGTVTSAAPTTSRRQAPAPLGGSYVSSSPAPRTEGAFVSLPSSALPLHRGTYVTTFGAPRVNQVGSYTFTS